MSSQSAQARIDRDVVLVRREARYVITLVGEDESVRHNPNGNLNVVAIIGPGEYKGVSYPKALLMEAGIGKTRPYHRARPREDVGNISYRMPLCGVDAVTYTRISDVLFDLLQRITNERVGAYKWGPHHPFLLRIKPKRFTPTTGLQTTVAFKEKLRGCRFSFAKRDSWALADIYWLQLNRMNGKIAKWITKTLRLHEANADLSRTKSGRWLGEQFQKACPLVGQGHLQPYVLIDALRRLPKGRQYPHYSQLCQLISTVAPDWRGGLTSEQVLATKTASNPGRRLAGICLRDTSGLDRRYDHKDHVTFELFPYSWKRKDSIKRPA